MKVDYIIVGQGFAGSFLALELLQRNKSFVIYDTQKDTASRIAAGIYNPLVLKRFTPIWQAELQIDFLEKKIEEVENVFNQNILVQTPILRIFNDENEHKTWIKKSHRPRLRNFMDEDTIDYAENIFSPFGLGKVQKSGRIDTQVFFKSITDFLTQNHHLRLENFDYESLVFLNNELQYKEIQAQKIIFAEGFGVKKNPFFKNLPIESNKGECLFVETKKPLENYIYKKKHFLFPMEKNLNYLGGSYISNEENAKLTNSAKIELLEDMHKMYNDSIEIKEHFAAIRPVTIDRRPIIGQHPKHERIFILNGLGTRGTILGAFFANQLLHSIENKIKISSEVDLQRFKEYL